MGVTDDNGQPDFFELWRNAGKTPEPAPRPLHAVPTRRPGSDPLPYAIGALTRECDAIAAMPPDSGRNMALNKAAFRLGRHIGAGSIDLDTVRDALEHAARLSGLPQPEIDKVLRDNIDGGLVKGQEVPRHVPAPRTSPPPAQAPVIPDDLWSRPTLDHIRRFALARRCSPLAVLAVSLVRALAITPPHVVLPPYIGSYGALNAFVAVVGASGSGKGSAERCARDAIDMGHIRVVPTGSGEGVAALYTRREKGKNVDSEERSAIVSVAEVSTLTALKARQGATILGELCKAWSGEQLGFQNSDPERTRIVAEHTYRLCAVVGVQPTKANGLLDEADQGVPQRFVWVSSLDTDAPDMPPAEPSPITLDVDMVRFRAPFGRFVFAMPDVVRQTVDEVRLSRLRGEGEPLDGHALQTRMKVAAGFAVLDERTAANNDDWNLAGILMAVSDGIRARAVAELQRAADRADDALGRREGVRQAAAMEAVAKSSVQRIAPKIRKRLLSAGGEMATSEARRQCAHRDRDYFDDAIEALVAAGDVVIRDTNRGTHIALKEGS